MSLQKKLISLSLPILGLFAATSPSLKAQATHITHDWSQDSAFNQSGDSLRDYLVRLRSSLFLLKDKPEQQQPLKLSANVTAESRSGVRRLRIRNFQYLSDGSRAIAEYNLGAGSWPTLVGVLGSAVADEFLRQAAIRGIPLDDVEVIFTSVPGTAPSTSTGTQVTYPRGLSYTAYIVSPASDAELEALRVAVEENSAILNLITHHRDIVAHGALDYTQTPEKREGKLEGLREYLRDKHAAEQGAIPVEGLPPKVARAEGEPPLRADIRVEAGTGIRHVRTDDSNFQILHDSPRYLGGHNLAPVAEEHLIGTMITCLTHIYEIQAAKKEIALDTLKLEVEATLSTHIGNIENPPRYQSIRYTVHIGSPEPKEKIEELQKAVESICPVYNLLKDSQPVKGAVVRGPYKDAKAGSLASN